VESRQGAALTVRSCPGAASGDSVTEGAGLAIWCETCVGAGAMKGRLSLNAEISRHRPRTVLCWRERVSSMT